MFTIRCLAAATCLTLLATGCSGKVAGKWSLSTVEPTAATRDMEYTSLTLQEDGTFYAEAINGTVKSQSGTYSYDNKVLDLVAHNGERETFDVRRLTSRKMCVEQFWRGQKLKAEFVRKE
jgi:hypothetical protein